MFPKMTWQEKVKGIHDHHVKRIKEEEHHGIRDTAKELRFSAGYVSEALTLHSWMITYPKLAEIPTIAEALNFVRTKKKELRLR